MTDETTVPSGSGEPQANEEQDLRVMADLLVEAKLERWRAEGRAQAWEGAFLALLERMGDR